MPRVEIPPSVPPAGSRAVPVSRRRTRPPVRRWRRLGRRAQVAPVATILGLLIVVAIIANYLTTTVPSQMSVNDVLHEIQVEDQVGELQALLDSAAASGRTGAPVSQPITLGSPASPPFAGSDGASLTPGNLSGGFNVNFTVGGAPSAVGGGPSEDGAAGKGACTGAGTTRCAAGAWFTTTAISPAVANDLLVFAMTVYEESAALTAAYVSDTSGSAWTILTVGGNALGSNYVQYIFWAIDPKTGSDTVTFNTGTTGPNAHDGSAILFALENVNTATPIDASGTFSTGDATTAPYTTSATVAAPASGLVLGIVSSGNPGATASEFPTITAGSATTPCTATCTAIASEDGEAWGETFGEYEPATTAGTYTASATGSIEPQDWGELAVSINPALTTPVGVPIASGASPPGASLVVHLSNTYAPAAEVAFDQGAVVFVEPGGVPLLIDPPPLSYGLSTITLTIPIFRNVIPSESGTGTADIMLRLISTSSYKIPVTGYTLQHHVTLTLKTPYWAAWMTYFNSESSFAGLVSCKNLVGVTCPAPSSVSYQPGAPLAVITLSLPATSLNLEVALFSVSVS